MQGMIETYSNNFLHQKKKRANQPPGVLEHSESRFASTSESAITGSQNFQKYFDFQRRLICILAIVGFKFYDVSGLQFDSTFQLPTSDNLYSHDSVLPINKKKIGAGDPFPPPSWFTQSLFG